MDVSIDSAPVTVQFTDTSQGAVTGWRWDFGDDTSSTDQDPAHEYTIAGTYTVQLEVSGPGGTDTSVMSGLITVEPGSPVSLEVSPPTVTLAVQEGIQFTAVARDEFGNVVPGTFDWAMDGEGGSITGDGLFTADTVAGTFANIIAASLQSGELVGSASVTVEPGPLSEVIIDPVETVLDIGATQTFTLMAFDQFRNEIPDALASWTVQPDVATIDAGGLGTAGTKSGLFQDAIRVDVVQGALRASATADVTILPDLLASIEVEPSFTVVENGSTHQFEASGFDQYGNQIPGLAILWEATGGQITQTGFFTASALSGSYEAMASATHRDSLATGSATVEIPLRVSVDPKATFLHTAADDSPTLPTILDLGGCWICPGRPVGVDL